MKLMQPTNNVVPSPWRSAVFMGRGVSTAPGSPEIKLATKSGLAGLKLAELDTTAAARVCAECRSCKKDGIFRDRIRRRRCFPHVFIEH